MSAPFSNEEKQIISQMYKDVLGKVLRVTKCNTCFHDAVIEMYVHLVKKGNTMANELNYIDNEQLQNIENQYVVIAQMLSGLRNSKKRLTIND